MAPVQFLNLGGATTIQPGTIIAELVAVDDSMELTGLEQGAGGVVRGSVQVDLR